MRQKLLNELLSKLPQKDHADAQRRIEIAEKFGWKDVGLWTFGIGKPHIDDLTGIGERGEIHFLKDLDESGDTLDGAD